MHSKYFEYNKKTKKFNARKRPTNQSSDDVLDKLNGKIANLQLNPIVKNPPVYKKFMNIFKKSAGSRAPIGSHSIDICHGVSIANIMKLMVAMMNQKKPLPDVQELVVTFEDAMLNSTDLVSNFIQKIREYEKDPKTTMQMADTLALTLNCAPNNLAPGTKSVNCSIGADNDPHLIRLKLREGGGYVLCTLPTYTAIKNSFEALASAYVLDYSVESTLSKSSALNAKTKKYDNTLFADAVRMYVSEETANLTNVISDGDNGLHPYENPLFKEVCNHASVLANLVPYTDQDKMLAEDIRWQQCVIGYEQNNIDHKYRYGYDLKDAPGKVSKYAYED